MSVNFLSFKWIVQRLIATIPREVYSLKISVTLFRIKICDSVPTLFYIRPKLANL